MIGFDKLNPMQKKAVLQLDGPVLVLAGAGSGKTGALTVRIANMIEKGISPWNILAITFTNKAAKEMRERVNNLIGDKAQDIWVSTFHSTCVRILRRDIDKIGYDKKFSIYDSSDQEKVMKECFKRLNFSITDKTFTVKAAISEIAKLKEELISYEEFHRRTDGDLKKMKIAKVYKVYQDMLRTSNALDFDDLIYKTVLLFRTCPDVLEYYQEKFKYIMVDEYQDTNTSQYEFVRLIADKYKNLCVVGDDDQSIYGWRGANIRNILEFEKDFENTVVIKLEQNYRSTKTILDAANSIIHNNVTRKSKSLWTENDTGSIIYAFRAENEFEEGRFVADKINEYAIKDGKKYSDFAVLYRTNAQSRAVEDQFIKKDIPYRVYGGIRFYDRMEIRDIIAYLKAVANSTDDISMKRIINVPKRGLGDTSVEKINQFAIENEICFYEALSRVNEITELKSRAKKFYEFYEMMEEFKSAAEYEKPSEIIDLILRKTEYLREFKEEDTDESRMRIENVDEFVTKAIEFEKNMPVEEANLTTFLEDIALVADIDNYSEEEDTVALMTLHSAKGLEFPYVFIVGMEEGMFPSYRSINFGGQAEMEEERRLAYVGITRAKEVLYLTYARSRMQHGMTEYNAPSRFLKEIPLELIENKNKDLGIKKPYSAGNKSYESIGTGGLSKYARRTPFGINSLNSVSKPLPKPENVTLNFEKGDKVRAPKHGIGTVVNINPAGADYEIEVSFGEKGNKKFLATLSKLIKV